jgi:hypothetical protein
MSERRNSVLTENRTLQADELIKSITQKINVKSDNIKDWNKAIQFVFTDASPYWIKITNGKVEAIEKANQKQESPAPSRPFKGSWRVGLTLCKRWSLAKLRWMDRFL